MAEVDVLRQMEHPNILALIDWTETATFLYIALEFCETDLFEYMNHHTAVVFEEHVVAHYMRQLLDAVAYLHSHRVVHMDIKPENIMLQDTSVDAPVIKLIGFGIAQRCPEGSMLPQGHGTPLYMSPEQ